MSKISRLSHFYSINRQKGQALLVVVLVMVIALTVGLSVASRTITSFRNSTEVVNSQKALSAAEAGIEQALKSNLSVANPNFSQDSGYDTKISSVRGTSFLLNNGNFVPQDEGIDLWLSDYSSESAKLYQNTYPANGSFTLYWGDSSGGCNNAALEVVLIVGSKTSPVLTRFAFDPCQTRSTQNGFTFINPTQATVNGKTFSYQATVSPVGNGNVTGGGGLIARIVPLYKNASVGVISTSALPVQGYVLASTGSSGNVIRKVNVFQAFPQIPAEYYLYNLFSP